MPLELVTVPCLQDNYAFLLHDAESGKTALIDAPEAAPIEAALARQGWTLSEIWLTHHHDDHIQAVPGLRDGTKVVGAQADTHRLPTLDLALADGDSFDFAGHSVQVMDVSGHTVGHIAFYVADAGAAFTGDSLMAMGCGRLFEGTPAQMWASLSKLSALPPETLVCSGHEYTASNARFAQTIEPDNAALAARVEAITQTRNAGQATVPSFLSDEQASNPFLRAHLQELKDGLGMSEASDVDVFAKIRARKDRF